MIDLGYIPISYAVVGEFEIRDRRSLNDYFQALVCETSTSYYRSESLTDNPRENEFFPQYISILSKPYNELILNDNR
jgi:hypothetical protein